MIREAIILAGGLGTRLKPVVGDLPKCLAPVAGKPFLGYLLDFAKKQGIKKFIFALGYKSELIESFVKKYLPATPICFRLKKNHWAPVAPYLKHAKKLPVQMRWFSTPIPISAFHSEFEHHS